MLYKIIIILLLSIGSYAKESPQCVQSMDSVSSYLGKLDRGDTDLKIFNTNGAIHGFEDVEKYCSSLFIAYIGLDIKTQIKKLEAYKAKLKAN